MTEEFTRRLVSLETWKQQCAIEKAVDKVNREHMDDRFDALEKEFTSFRAEMRGLFTKILWAIALPVVSSGTIFVISGGLNGVIR